MITVYIFELLQDQETNSYFWFLVYDHNGREKEEVIGLSTLVELMDKFEMDIIEDECLPEPLYLDYEECLEHANEWECEEWEAFIEKLVNFKNRINKLLL